MTLWNCSYCLLICVLRPVLPSYVMDHLMVCASYACAYFRSISVVWGGIRLILKFLHKMVLTRLTKEDQHLAGSPGTRLMIFFQRFWWSGDREMVTRGLTRLTTEDQHLAWITRDTTYDLQSAKVVLRCFWCGDMAWQYFRCGVTAYNWRSAFVWITRDTAYDLQSAMVVLWYFQCGVLTASADAGWLDWLVLVLLSYCWNTGILQVNSVYVQHWILRTFMRCVMCTCHRDKMADILYRFSSSTAMSYSGSREFWIILTE